MVIFFYAIRDDLILLLQRKKMVRVETKFSFLMARIFLLLYFSSALEQLQR